MIKNEEGYADPTYAGAYKMIRQEINQGMRRLKPKM